MVRRMVIGHDRRLLEVEISDGTVVFERGKSTDSVEFLHAPEKVSLGERRAATRIALTAFSPAPGARPARQSTLPLPETFVNHIGQAHAFSLQRGLISHHLHNQFLIVGEMIIGRCSVRRRSSGQAALGSSGLPRR